MMGVREAMRPIESRVRLMIGRAIVRLVDDARQLQELQIDLLADESQDAVEHFQPYGFAAHPHAGAEALVGCVGGLRSHAVVIAVADRRYRLLNLQQGEVALFDDLGNVVKLGRDKLSLVAVNDLELTAGGAITMTAPGGLQVAANVTVDGTIDATGEVTGNGIALSTHMHSGVTAGGDVSGGPE